MSASSAITLAAPAREPIMLLHASASGAAQWRACARLLDQRRVALPELFGYGATPAWPGPGAPTLADEATPLAAHIESLGRPVHVVGHSYGGAVALRLAHDHPRLVSRMTLIEPVAFQLLRDDEPELFAEVAAVAAAVRFNPPAFAMEWFVDYWNGRGAWWRLRPEVRAALCRQAATVGLNFETTMTEPTTLADCARTRTPTRVLRGTESPAPVRRIAELLARAMPNARLETVAGGGHMLPLTHPAVVAGATVDGLRGATIAA